jgi:hypothetical protein
MDYFLENKMDLPLIPQDKANHTVYGSIIASIICSATTIFMLLFDIYTDKLYEQHLIAAVIGLSAATAAGVIKELIDKRANNIAIKLGLVPPHSVEIADALYTTQGGIIAALPLIIASLPHYVGM